MSNITASFSSLRDCIQLSICVLSYNRPLQIADLLNSIDVSDHYNVEIIVCDDFSPRRREIYEAVRNFEISSGRKIIYFQHVKNYGYDETLYDLVEMASGEWTVFMGDDDFFVPGALDKYLEFLANNREKNLGYVMKSHFNITRQNKKEYFRYYDGTKFFAPGVEAYIALFRKSVFISGFLIKTKLAQKYNTHDLDGTLLLQLYLLARAVFEFRSAYFAEFFTYQYTYNLYESSEIMYCREKDKYVERVASPEVSLNFLGSYLKVIRYVDEKCGTQVADKVLLDISKYSYPSLAIQRHLGLIQFSIYCMRLREMGFAKSFYFYIYYFALVVLGANLCNRLIYGLRNRLGVTPSL